jgi:hypothetical protein
MSEKMLSGSAFLLLRTLHGEAPARQLLIWQT